MTGATQSSGGLGKDTSDGRMTTVCLSSSLISTASLSASPASSRVDSLSTGVYCSSSESPPSPCANTSSAAVSKKTLCDSVLLLVVVVLVGLEARTRMYDGRDGSLLAERDGVDWSFYSAAAAAPAAATAASGWSGASPASTIPSTVSWCDDTPT
jgi:hypothetical protein